MASTRAARAPGDTAPATDGGAIYLRAGNTLTAGIISVAGANGGLRGSHGSRLDLLAHDATIGTIFGDGGSGTGGAASPPAGRGGGVFGRLTGRLDVGAISFRGGTGGGPRRRRRRRHRRRHGHDIDAGGATTAGGTGGGRGGERRSRSSSTRPAT